MLQIKNIIVSSKEPSVTDGILWINTSGKSKKILFYGENGWEELSGKNEGFVILDENGKVPSDQLPSYVDDVVEYGSKDSFPTDGEKGKIYVDTATNSTYRWSGTQYINVSNPANFGGVSDIVCNSPSFKQEGRDLTYEYDLLDKNTGEVEHFSSLVPTSTYSSNGVMSASDKGFIDTARICHPIVFYSEHGNPITVKYGDTNNDVYIAISYITSDTNITQYNLALPLADYEHTGLMSKEDKTKLDNITNNSLLNEKESKFINFLTEGKDLGPNIINRGVINFRQVGSDLNGFSGGFRFKNRDEETTVLEYAYTLIKENGDIIHGRDSTILPNVNDTSSGLMTPTQKAKLDSLGTIPVYNSIEEVPSDITSKCIVTVDDIPYTMEKCSMMTDKDTAPVSTYKLESAISAENEEGDKAAAYYTSYMRYIDGQWTEVYSDVAYDFATNLNFIYEQATGAVEELMGKPNGIATLLGDGKIPSSQLPSYVDDVVECYAIYDKDNTGNLSNIQIYTDAAHTNSITGETGKIYVNVAENEPGYQFRWTGSAFVQISAGGLVIGEIEGTAFDGKAGKNLKDWQDSKDATLPDVFITSIGSPTQTNEGVRFGASRRDKDATKDSQYNLFLNNATNTTNGLMSGKDKLKLNSLYNINSLNILEANNATSRQYTINLVKSVYDTGTTGSISDNLTIPSATSTEAGLMSVQDKVLFDKLGIDPDGLAVYTLYILFGQGFAMSDTFAFNATADELSFNWRGFKSGPNYVPGSTEQSINNDTGKRVLPLATTTTAGVMSASDKTKLDNVSGSIIYNAVNVDNENGTSVTRHFNFNHVNGNVQLAVPTINTNTGVTTVYSLPIPTATSEHNGVMSKEDKVKLDNIDDNVLYSTITYDKNGVITTDQIGFKYDTTNLDLVVVAKNTNTGEVSKVIKPIPVATQTHNGLLSNNDKLKLDSLGSIPIYASASNVPVDVTAKQIKLTVGGKELLFTKANNGFYVAFGGGVNVSTAEGKVEKLKFILLCPHLDNDNNVDSWFISNHVSLDEDKWEGLYTKITSLENRVVSLEAQINPGGGVTE